MANMTEFIAVTLAIVADFLARDPVIYLFGLACLGMTIKVFRQLLP